MLRFALGTLFVGGIITFGVACGSSSSGGSGSGVVSSIDPNKSVSSLSDQEARQYCLDTTAYADRQVSELDAKRYACGVISAAFAGIGATSDEDAKTKCKAAVDDCLAKPETTGDAGVKEEPCADAKADAKTKACPATIAELNQCQTDQIAALKAMIGKDQCAEAKASSGSSSGGLGAKQERPASCVALEKKCPGLYEDDKTDE